MLSVRDLCDDLAAEHASLDSVVAGQPDSVWATPTPASGWDVRDTISHLCFYDEFATGAIAEPGSFEQRRDDLIRNMSKGATPDVEIGRTARGPGELLERWRRSRAAFLAAALTAASQGEKPPRIAWFGPPMSLASFTTARIMETWAHGVDIRDALDVPLEFGSRLRHVIHIGVGARAFSFAVHGETDPGDPVTVIAALPDVGTWEWPGKSADGEPAADTIRGSALDLALVFTQRRHQSHTDVRATGRTAERWLAVAQAFAGPPTITATDR